MNNLVEFCIKKKKSHHLVLADSSEFRQHIGHSDHMITITGFAFFSTSTKFFQFKMQFIIDLSKLIFKRLNFNFSFLFRKKMTTSNVKNNHLDEIPLQKFFCKGLKSSFPSFFFHRFTFQKEMVWNTSAFTQLASLPFQVLLQWKTRI